MKYLLCFLLIGCNAAKYGHVRHSFNTEPIQSNDTLEVRQCIKYNCTYLDTFYLKPELWKKQPKEK